MISGFCKKLVYALLAGLVLCPLRWRFAVMCKLACWLCPLVRLALRCGLHQLTLEGARELSLKVFVSALVRHNIPFQTRLELCSAEGWTERGGVLLLTCHFQLNRLFLRWLCEQGRRVCVVTVHPSLQEYVGRDYPLELIPRDAQCLFRIRQQIKAGKIVYLTTESTTPSAMFHRPVDFAGQDYFLSDTALRFAEQAGLPVAFVVPSVERDGRVVVKLARPSASHSDVAMSEFCQFLSTEVAQFS